MQKGKRIGLLIVGLVIAGVLMGVLHDRSLGVVIGMGEAEIAESAVWGRFDPVDGQIGAYVLDFSEEREFVRVLCEKRVRLVRWLPKSTWKDPAYLIDILTDGVWRHVTICEDGTLSTDEHTYKLRPEDAQELMALLSRIPRSKEGE